MRVGELSNPLAVPATIETGQHGAGVYVALVVARS